MPRKGPASFTLAIERPRRSVALVQQTDLLWIEGDLLEPDPSQPRSEIDVDGEEFLQLVESIRAEGVVQPLNVRPPDPRSGRHLVTAGHRRLAAGRIAGVDRFPCLVQDVDTRKAFLFAFTENVHRQALTDMDTASALQRIREDWDLGTVEDLAEFVHRSRPWTQRMLAAARLDVETRRLMAEREESAALAIPLLGQSPEDRRRTLDAVAELPNRDEKVRRASRIKELTGAGRSIDEAIAIASVTDHEVAAGPPASPPVRTSNGSAPRLRGRPRHFIPAYQWREGIDVLDATTARLACAQAFRTSTLDVVALADLMYEDLATIHDELVDRPEGRAIWAEIAARFTPLFAGDEPE
jgi:ParB/RepB/Spo0J family partition protein